MRKIKIVQLGTTHEHAAAKIISLRRLSNIFEIAGYVDDSEFSVTPHLEPAMSYYEGLRAMTLDELWNNPEIEAVFVEVPNNELVPMAIRCMERNLAIHMDKPAGENIELYGKLLTGCEAKGLPFQMGYMFRGNAAMQKALEIIRRGIIGEVFEIQCTMNHNYGGEIYRDYIGQFQGGTMYNLGCHMIDFIVAMMGKPDNVTPFLHPAPGCKDFVHNNCTAVLEYHHAIAVVRVCSAEIDGLNQRNLKICGTNGTINLSPLERFDGQKLTMQLHLQDARGGFAAGKNELAFEPVADRYESQLIDFAKEIRHETTDVYSRKHDFLVHQVTLAASGCIKWK